MTPPPPGQPDASTGGLSGRVRWAPPPPVDRSSSPREWVVLGLVLELLLVPVTWQRLHDHVPAPGQPAVVPSATATSATASPAPL